MEINKLKNKLHKSKNLLSTYVIGKKITSNAKFKYVLYEQYGKVDKRMSNAIPPDKMLEMGVFSGKYINDDISEYPIEWYLKAMKKNKLSPDMKNKHINKFNVESRMSLKQWKHNGWIYGEDKKGWFQWWCRYYIGLRRPDIDEIQIKRWLAFKRHWSQLEKNLQKYDQIGNPMYRAKQRQSLLQWAWKQPDKI